MERKFFVLLRRFSLRKEQSYFNIFVCSFLHPHGDRGAPLSAFGGSSNVREHTQPPTHSLLAFARAGCFGVVCVRLVASGEFSGNSKEKMVCARHKQILLCLPRPPCARTNPRRFEENYKTAGLLPLDRFYYFKIIQTSIQFDHVIKMSVNISYEIAPLHWMNV